MNDFKTTLYLDGAAKQSVSNDRRYKNFKGDLHELLVELRYLSKKYCNYDRMPNKFEKLKLPAIGQGLIGKDGTGLRSKQNTISAQLIGFDFDNKKKVDGIDICLGYTKEDILKYLDSSGLQYLFYESPSCRSDFFKCRVFFVLDRSIHECDEYERVYEIAIKKIFGEQEGVDMGCRDFSKLFFISPYPKMQRAFVKDGATIKVNDLLLEAPKVKRVIKNNSFPKSTACHESNGILKEAIDRLSPEQIYNHPAHQWHGKWQGGCPQHDSSSMESFHVDPVKKIWYCFGCGVGAGPLQYLSFCDGKGIDVRGQNFIEYAKQLYEMAGLDFEKRSWLQRKVIKQNLTESQVSDLANGHTAYRKLDSHYESKAIITKKDNWEKNETRSLNNFHENSQIANFSFTGDGKTFSVANAIFNYLKKKK